MTNREFFTAVAHNEITAEVIATANELIEKLDARNAKRSSKPSKVALANDVLANELYEMMEANMLYSASDIANMMGFKTEAGSPSTSKATAVVGVLEKRGWVTHIVGKVPKKGKCNLYSVVENESDGEDE